MAVNILIKLIKKMKSLLIITLLVTINSYSQNGFLHQNGNVEIFPKRQKELYDHNYRITHELENAKKMNVELSKIILQTNDATQASFEKLEKDIAVKDSINAQIVKQSVQKAKKLSWYEKPWLWFAVGFFTGGYLTHQISK